MTSNFKEVGALRLVCAAVRVMPGPEVFIGASDEASLEQACNRYASGTPFTLDKSRVRSVVIVNSHHIEQRGGAK